jgi:hypothetical protein
METALLIGAFTLLVGTSSGVVWWRLTPAQATGDRDRLAAGFDGPLRRWSSPTPPRPDEIEWMGDDAPASPWHRLARGAGLVALVAAAAAALALGLYLGGKYAFEELLRYFGSGLR